MCSGPDQLHEEGTLDLAVKASDFPPTIWVHTKVIFLTSSHLGLHIVYFMQYDTYHDTHEAMFNMYQWNIFSGYRQKKFDMSTNFMGICEF